MSRREDRQTQTEGEKNKKERKEERGKTALGFSTTGGNGRLGRDARGEGRRPQLSPTRRELNASWGLRGRPAAANPSPHRRRREEVGNEASGRRESLPPPLPPPARPCLALPSLPARRRSCRPLPGRVWGAGVRVSARPSG